jgi:hypothetical protein
MKNTTGELDRNSPLFREEASRQMDAMVDLGRVIDRLAAVAQKSFGITPEMGKAIGDAMNQMNEAMKSLEQRNGSSAASLQEGAMGSLNEAAQQVQASMSAMMQGGGQGMGMGALMQRMQGLTSMQQGINRGTRHLGGMSQREAAELGRLAGEQGAVRKSLEQLAREASQSGDMSKLLGDLNSIAQEMREVQTDLAQGNIRNETLRKQERILSRMLDSQRSMREGRNMPARIYPPWTSRPAKAVRSSGATFSGHWRKDTRRTIRTSSKVTSTFWSDLRFRRDPERHLRTQH